jgi:hypothetical protein
MTFDMTPCSVVVHRFGETYYFHVQGRAREKHPAGFCNDGNSTLHRNVGEHYRTTWLHTPEDSAYHSYHIYT